MEDCIFCKIVADEVPSEKATHKDGKVVSLRDLHPLRPGHTLIIPVEHHRWFWEMPDELSSDVFKIAREVSAKLKEEQKSDYVQLSIIGKDVPHVHMHLIPRMFDDTEKLV
jgi:histidine triad (HIT) family protein